MAGAVGTPGRAGTVCREPHGEPPSPLLVQGPFGDEQPPAQEAWPRSHPIRVSPCWNKKGQADARLLTGEGRGHPAGPRHPGSFLQGSSLPWGPSGPRQLLTG